MSDVNFTELLSKDIESAERPKPLPSGTYRLEITGHEFGTSSQKGTPFVQFNFKVVEPGEDVDPEDLDDVKEWQKRTLQDKFYLTEAAMYRLREFMEKRLGLDCTGRTFDQNVPETHGCEVEAFLKQTPSQREGDDSVYTNIDRYM